MHFITRAVYKYRRDEKNCHAGCMRCNVILHGNYIVYTRRMQRKYGEILVDEMINDKQIARGLMDGITRKDTADTVREFLSPFSSMRNGAVL